MPSLQPPDLAWTEWPLATGYSAESSSHPTSKLKASEGLNSASFAQKYVDQALDMGLTPEAIPATWYHSNDSTAKRCIWRLSPDASSAAASEAKTLAIPVWQPTTSRAPVPDFFSTKAFPHPIERADGALLLLIADTAWTDLAAVVTKNGAARSMSAT